MSLAQRCAAMPVLPRRVVALLLVPMSIAIMGYLAVFATTSIYVAQQDWRSNARSVFSKAAAAADMQARVDRDAAALKASPLWSQFYLSPTAGMGAVQLQTDIGSLLIRSQASTQSITPIPSLSLDGFTRIGVRLSASMRIDQLKSFLASAATHARFLRVEQLAVTAPVSQAQTENAPLAVTMEVYGFELKERPQ